MRLFVAVDVPSDVCDELAECEAALREWLPGARFSPPGRRHITLAFLGEVASDEPFAGALAEVSRPRFTVSLGELGTFGSRSGPRVVWAGIGRGVRELTALADAVSRALESAGYVPGRRGFVPHLTLARTPRRAWGVQPRVAVPGTCFEVDEFVLYRSILGRGPARHMPLRRYPLL